MQQVADVLAPLGVAYTPGEGEAESEMGLMQGQGVAAAALDHDGTGYFDLHHTPNDTLDKIDPKQLAQNVAVYAAFTWMTANADGSLGSDPKAAWVQKAP